MKIGFLGFEYFWYKQERDMVSPTSAHGGFGYLTRKKCEELVKLGHEVHVFIPSFAFSRHGDPNADMDLNGVQVHLYRTTDLFGNSDYTKAFSQLRESVGGIKALRRKLNSYPIDLFQSEEPYIFTYEASRINKNQIVVFQDPFDAEDKRLMSEASLEYFNILNENSGKSGGPNLMIKNLATKVMGKTVKNRTEIKPIKKVLDNINNGNVYTEADFISQKVRSMYELDYTPKVLRNPQDFPISPPEKSSSPSILWVARWDLQKRPDIALRTAKELPDYDFYLIGAPNDILHYKEVSQILRNKYKNYPNIHILDFVTEEQKNRLLSQSWILLNTSVREGLPISFLEAGANAMSIISSVNPDSYTEKYGAHVTNGNFKEAIETAVKEEWHKTKGLNAFEGMKKLHETSKVMNEHIKIYKSILSS